MSDLKAVPWVMWGTTIHPWRPRGCSDAAALTAEQRSAIETASRRVRVMEAPRG